MFEVFYGIEGADDPDELLPRYEALFAGKPRVELTDRAARRGGRLYARHETSDGKGRPDPVDAMVAAIGLDVGEPVVTNDRAVGDVDGLDVRAYRAYHRDFVGRPRRSRRSAPFPAPHEFSGLGPTGISRGSLSTDLHVVARAPDGRVGSRTSECPPFDGVGRWGWAPGDEYRRRPVPSPAAALSRRRPEHTPEIPARRTVPPGVVTIFRERGDDRRYAKREPGLSGASEYSSGSEESDTRIETVADPRTRAAARNDGSESVPTSNHGEPLRSTRRINAPSIPGGRTIALDPEGPSEMPAIRTDGLTKRFGEDVVAVDALDLTVGEGEVFGFLGPNGAGKSTVIDMLLDFVRPTEGSATVLGYDPRTDADRIRRRTGVLPEGASLYGRLTGREHVEWIARANGSEADVDALLERVGISTSDADRTVGGYSTGMRQRLAFGMALVGEPDLLVLDEPSSGLDPAGMRDLREIVRTEADRGRTVFFSSHLLGEVEAVCDRVGIMNDGRLAAVGTPEELRESFDPGGTVRFEVETVPDDLGLETVAGVETVTVEEGSVVVAVGEPAAKIDVAVRLAERTRVLDIVSEDASLERPFETYTSNGRRRTNGTDTEPGSTADTEPVAVVGEP